MTRLTLGQRLTIARAVWPELAEKPDHQLWYECLEIGQVLELNGKLWPEDKEKEAKIREMAKEWAA